MPEALPTTLLISLQMSNVPPGRRLSFDLHLDLHLHLHLHTAANPTLRLPGKRSHTREPWLQLRVRLVLCCAKSIYITTIDILLPRLPSTLASSIYTHIGKPQRVDFRPPHPK